MKTLLIAAAAALGLATSAQALTPVLTDVSAVGDRFLFTYSLTLNQNEGVRTGDRLVIFDFNGFDGFGPLSDPAIGTFTELTTPVGGVNNLQPPAGFDDDASVLNIGWRWDGPDVFTTGPHPPVDFMLSAYSRFDGTQLDGFSSLTVKNNGAAAGQPLYEQGAVAVPVGAAVPEPGTWALMIIGFGGAGAMLRARRRRAFA
jgi:hypothetical protein